MVGSSPSFSVAVAGSGPFGYEWYFAGTNLVQSGTNNTLTLPNVSTNNAGNYTVVVTNTYGSVTSQVATSVVFPPTVTSQPASQTNLPGTNVSFNVAVEWNRPIQLPMAVQRHQFPEQYHHHRGGQWTATTAIPATAARPPMPALISPIWFPSGVAFDAIGNLFIADT